MTELDASIRAALHREQSLSARARREHGVVHTPPELARWALSRVHLCLQQDFQLSAGLGEASVQLLDPAIGTGVWLAAALELTRGHRSPRTLLGFDLDASALTTTENVLADEARAQQVNLVLRCTNTLEHADPWPPSRSAVRVIVGNPPWAARSLSRGTPLSDAWLAEFRCDHLGNPLGERRSGVLSDDYVRFFRWALEQARTAPAGAIVCFATNASFLDGPVHRGMRAALSRAFDWMDVLDLGGNALLSRRAERDENVFGVRVGAALTLAVRLPGSAPRTAHVTYARLVGSRAEKLAALDAAGPSSQSTQPAAPWFHFRPRTQEPAVQGFSLAEAFPFHREGVQTNRDELAMDTNREELEARLQRILRGEVPLSAARHFEPRTVREKLRRALEANPAACIRAISYRPFDTRFVCTVAPLCHRPRPELARALDHSQLALLSVRKERGAAPFSLFGASRRLTDACFLSNRSSCRTRVFPSHDPEGAVNLAPLVQERFAALAGAADVCDVMAYSLGVLASRLYRAWYGEALKLDYPRIPWPTHREAFDAFACAGRALVAAFCDEMVQLPQHGLVAHGSLAQRLQLRDLHFEPNSCGVQRRGERLLSGVAPALWQSTVGHHGVVRVLAARAESFTLEELAFVLRRTAHALIAADAADAAFRGYFQA